MEASYETSIDSEDFLSTGYCEKGYKGVLCLECEEGHGVSTKFDCVHCGDLWELFKKLILLVLRIYFFWVSIQQAFRMNESLSKAFCEEIKENVNSAYYLKILTQHFQTIFMLYSLPFEYPSLLKNSLSFVVIGIAPDFQTVFSAECFMKTIGLRIPVHYFRLTLILTLNILTLIIFILVSFKKKKNYKRNLLTQMSGVTNSTKNINNQRKKVMTMSSVSLRLEHHYRNPFLVIFYIYLILQGILSWLF